MGHQPADAQERNPSRSCREKGGNDKERKRRNAVAQHPALRPLYRHRTFDHVMMMMINDMMRNGFYW
ncbi:MAG: hypothetical protein ACK55Z_24250 [bacterium]